MTATFIVVDTNPLRKTSVARTLLESGYVIPCECVDDVAPLWPERAWLIVSAEGASAEIALDRLEALGKFYPLIMYGNELAAERAASLAHRGMVGILPSAFSVDQATDCVARLQPMVDQMCQRIEDARDATRRIALLSSREAEVMKRVSQGLSNKEISLALAISPRTVEIHRAKAIAKLGVPNGFAAARLFFLAEAMHFSRPLASRLSLPLALAA